MYLMGGLGPIYRSILNRILVDTRSSIGQYTYQSSIDRCIDRYSYQTMCLAIHQYFTDDSPTLYRYFNECTGRYQSIYQLIHQSILDRHSTMRQMLQYRSIYLPIEWSIYWWVVSSIARYYLVSVDILVKLSVKYQSIYWSIASVDMSADMSTIS